ncbi:MAG TPA: site-specific integrase [Candidatus Eisenbergiella merdavium]|uniref:Site-specific integrase n=1 Tax=Candidatus Eisenbergiella merdavium TaxID=2838551 RepID=A0A9D2NJB2_9FIRM|nr:site-specific integrase [Candidatus Eisenbergiella merdavium]
MAKAKKLPSGSWRCQVYDYTDEAGKRHYKSFTALTRKEAEYLAADFAMSKKEKSGSSKTFGEALDDYISRRSAVLSPRTIMDYQRIRKYDVQSLMEVPVCEITQEMVQAAINEDAKIHSPKTVRNNHGLISAVLRCERPNFALNTALPKKVRPDLYVPSDEDVRRLMQAVAGTDMELPILLAAFGPMRRGEICALDSRDISGNIVHVCRNMVITAEGKWIIKAPKSYAGDRYIDFPDFVAAKWKGISGKITHLTPDQITNNFSRVLRHAEITHFRFHDLRHYSASVQHALGIPDAYIMQRGGWSSDGVLKNVYRHAMNDRQEDMNRIANAHFERLMQHEMQHKK